MAQPTHHNKSTELTKAIQKLANLEQQRDKLAQEFQLKNQIEAREREQNKEQNLKEREEIELAAKQNEKKQQEEEKRVWEAVRKKQMEQEKKARKKGAERAEKNCREHSGSLYI